MKKKKVRNKSIILRVLVVGICVYMIITLSGLLNELSTARAELNKYKAEYSLKQTEIEELKSLLSEDSRAKMIEKAARERLGYVFPDEQVFIDISGG